MSVLPALPRTVSDLIDEYDEKVAGVEQAIKSFEDAFDTLQMAATVAGAFVEPVGQRSYLYADSGRAAGAWIAPPPDFPGETRNP